VPQEWLSGVLACDDCAAEYDADLDECPNCGSLDAELVGAGAGPGRFWGYRGLRSVLAVRRVTPGIGVQAGRVMRRWHRAKGLTKQINVERVERSTGRVLHPSIAGAEAAVRARPRLHLRERRAGLRLPACPLPLGPPFPGPGLPRGADSVRPGAAAGVSVERPTGRTTAAPAAVSGSPSGAP